MSAGPESHELVEAVVLQLGNGTGDAVGAVGGSLDDGLHGGRFTFLMSVSFLM